MVRFCLAIDHRDWTRGDPGQVVERTLQYARHADDAGFDSLWVNEDPDGWDAFGVLGAISRETRHIRLGTGVTTVFHRNPNLIAASVATLDRLSRGRAFLGIGRGQPEVYRRLFGIETDSPLDRLNDAIGLLRQWWEADGTAEGPGLSPGARWQRTILPARQPPLYIAAVGPRALALAGMVADGVLFNELATPAYIRWAIRQCATAAAHAGRDPGALHYFVNPALRITDDPASVLESKKTFVALVHALPGMERQLMTNMFDVPAIMAEVRAAMRTDEVLARGGLFEDLREAGDLETARSLIPAGLIDEAAAIGSIEHVRDRLAAYVEAGATHIFVDRRGLATESAATRAILDQVRPRD